MVCIDLVSNINKNYDHYSFDKINMRTITTRKAMQLNDNLLFIYLNHILSNIRLSIINNFGKNSWR